MAKVIVSPLRKKEKRKHAEAPELPTGSWGGTRFHLEIISEGERFDVQLSPVEMLHLHSMSKRAIREMIQSTSVFRKMEDELAARRYLEGAAA